MISTKRSISEILTYNPALRTVFDRYDLWQSEPGMPLYQIDECIFSDHDFLIEILRAFDKPSRFCPTRFLRFPLHIVLDYLYRTHRYYSQKRMLEIEQSIEQLALTYGRDHQLFLLLQTFFSSYRVHLEEHMSHEEDTLFPYILDLEERIAAKGKKHPESIFSYYSLEEFLVSHEDEELEEQLAGMYKLIHQRYPKIRKTFLFQVLTTQLKSFEKDLFIHEQIEENVLVPQARKLEKKLGI